MLTRGIKFKLLAFVVVGLLATAYLAARYVGIDPVNSGYHVTVTLPDAGGLFTNGEVTYRGVPVGRIESLKATSDGVTATLRIDASAPPLPADVSVSVADRSVIGEQYLNLAGRSTKGAHLRDGDRLTATAADLPPDINDLLSDASDFADSVPTKDLETVLDEGYDIAQGTAADDLRRLLTTSQTFQKQADDNFLASSALIKSSDTVLATQARSSASIRSYSSDLSLLARTMADSDSDLRTLLTRTPGSANQLTQLVKDVGTPMGLLMNNLVPTATTFGDNAAGIRDTMVRAPEAFSIGWAISGSKGMNMGLIPTFFDPLPCTQGYAGTQMRTGLTTTAGKPLNLQAGCTTTKGNVMGPASLGASSTSTSTADKVKAKVTVPDSLADLMGGQQ
ncbi:MlaD family protein [Nocardioides sp. DS6]|uniref:MlaD family protein n=1 Tax=Nocardioides eburneus TaxID=3231482 RepID=A0ABV3STC3_9ACTN